MIEKVKETINISTRDDGTLEIYIGNAFLAEITDGRDDEDFIEEILNDMGYIWNKDGTITKA